MGKLFLEWLKNLFKQAESVEPVGEKPQATEQTEIKTKQTPLRDATGKFVKKKQE